MSKYNEQVVSTCKVVDDFLRRSGPVSYGSSKLSLRDSATYKAAVAVYFRLILDLLDDGTPDCPRWALPWCKTMLELDVEQLSRFLKSSLKFFRNYPVSDKVDWVGFKHLFKNDFPLVGAFMAPIKEESERFLRAPNPHCFAIINQYLSFLSPLSLRDVDFTSKAIEEYLVNEQRMTDFKHDHALYDELNVIMREWFSGFHFEGFFPQNGSGATAFLQGKSLEKKYKNMGSDSMLRYFLRKVELSESDIFPIPPVPLQRKCEITFVAKNLQSCRTISMEPASLQYLQQGVWASLRPFLRSHHYLRNRFYIHEEGQDLNRKLARQGSFDGSYATIDLSSASDTVSWQMVKHVFKGTEYLLAAYATRSRSAVLPNGKTVPLQKFAPMGSALCFPTECLIFCSVCEYARRMSGLPDSQTDYRVFGDDIVVRREIFQSVVTLLSQCGFIINTSKTFYHPYNPFRESCGGEYYLGINVTPLRISRKFSADLPTTYHPSVFSNHIAMANLAMTFDYRRVRQWFIHRLLSLPEMYWPRFTEDFTSLYSPNPTNFQLRHVWFDWWQEELYNFGVILPKYQEPQDPDSETIRLFEWYRLARDRDRLVYPEDLISVHIGRQTARLGSTLGIVSIDEPRPCLSDEYPIGE